MIALLHTPPKNKWEINCSFSYFFFLLSSCPMTSICLKLVLFFHIPSYSFCISLYFVHFQFIQKNDHQKETKNAKCPVGSRNPYARFDRATTQPPPIPPPRRKRGNNQVLCRIVIPYVLDPGYTQFVLLNYWWICMVKNTPELHQRITSEIAFFNKGLNRH